MTKNLNIIKELEKKSIFGGQLKDAEIENRFKEI